MNTAINFRKFLKIYGSFCTVDRDCDKCPYELSGNYCYIRTYIGNCGDTISNEETQKLREKFLEKNKYFSFKKVIKRLDF